MKILIIGGDKRYLILKEKLQEKYDITSIFKEEDLNKIDIKDYNIIILPISGVKNNYIVDSLDEKITLNKEIFKNINKNTIIYTGIINDNLKELVNNNKIVSFLTDKEVQEKNNYLTTLGILEEIKLNNPKKICILGYGNIGKLLFNYLSKENKDITIGVIEEEDYKFLGKKAFYTTDENAMKSVFKDTNYIVNTVPNNIIERKHLIDCNAPILDIASYPYGMSDNIKDEYKGYKRYLGIPAKRYKEEAGKILYKKLNKDLKGGTL